MKLLRWCKANAMPVIAVLAAAVTAVFVPPDAAYLGYYDVKTLSCLLCVLAVVGALRRVGLFPLLAQRLVQVFHTTRGAVTALVGITLVGSMLLTNDTALLTFLPLSWFVLERTGQTKWTALTFILQNCAANLGGMLTPFGNPQNLYLYSKSGMKISDFLMLMLPYNVAALIFLTIWATVICHHNSTSVCSTNLIKRMPAQANQKIILLDVILFIVCLLVVVRVLPYGIAFAIVLICTLCADRTTLRDVDYSLLLTFVAFFVFIGNLGRIPAFSNWLQSILAGREVIVSVLASQVTSNVPAALLLSGFTVKTDALIIGTNLGGLGTLIASMASLISYRQIAREVPEDKSRYFKLFSASNLIFLAILLAEWWIIRQ